MKKKEVRRLLSLILLFAICLTIVFIDRCSSKEQVPPKQNTSAKSDTEIKADPLDATSPEGTEEQTDPSDATSPEGTEERTDPWEQTNPTETTAGPINNNSSSQPGEHTDVQIPAGSALYYVTVNCQTNTVNVYKRDNYGQYTIPYRVMVCSSGLDQSPTPTGIYYLTGNRWEWLELVGNVWGMYTTQIIGDYLFHSVPYTQWGDHGSLQEGEFDKLGSDASHGCIRLQVKDAKWIYDHMWDIEAVEIYNGADPGPLGKPVPQKIGNSAYPYWDPTDPHEHNPWRSNPAPLPAESKPLEPDTTEMPSEPEITEATTEPEESTMPDFTEPEESTMPDFTEPEESTMPDFTEPEETTIPKSTAPDTTHDVTHPVINTGSAREQKLHKNDAG